MSKGKLFYISGIPRAYLWRDKDLPTPLPCGFPSDSAGREPAYMQETQETWVRFLGQEDPLEEEMATHSSVLAWRIPWSLAGYSL